MSISKLKSLWTKAIIEKNIKAITKLYAQNAILKGTMAKRSVRGRKDIDKYFQKFAPIVIDVKFEKDNLKVRKDNFVTEIGTYVFTTSEGRLTAQYNIVYCLEGEVKILSHFSNIFC